MTLAKYDKNNMNYKYKDKYLRNDKKSCLNARKESSKGA